MLDEALRESSAGPYLEMPDCMMNECIVGYWTDVGKTYCGLLQHINFVYSTEKQKDMELRSLSASNMHRFP